MFIQELFERRFERPTVMSTLAQYAHRPDVYVTFTEVLKVGINPDSQWDDPVGIYTYPVEQVMQGKTSNDGKLIPFGGERQHAFFVEATGNMLELQHLTSGQLDEHIGKLQRDYWDQLMLQPHDHADSTYTIDDPEEFWNENLLSWLNRWGAHPGLAFWKVTERMASYLARRQPTREQRMIWHKLIRSCGYDGVVDRGEKIISGNEPAQAVILHTGALRVLQAVRNV